MTTDLKAIRFIEGTKVSHDYMGNNIDLFSYTDLISRGIPSIGIPAKQNGLVIIDVDAGGAAHKHDGREWWQNFTNEYGIPPTYTVATRNGGYHYYFRLPQGLNPDTFRPPGSIADGVDVKYNGWVAAPPSAGYEAVNGSIETIADVPPSLMMFMANNAENGNVNRTFDMDDPHGSMIQIHKPFTLAQIEMLRVQISQLQQRGTLSYQEWRDGLFALKAGVEDSDVLYELTEKWTLNQSYVPGDEVKAHEIVEKASKHSGVGPGTIFHILKAVALREGAPIENSTLTKQEIIEKSRVPFRLHPQTGAIIIEPSESNVAELLGAMFGPEDLYHDVRQDSYIFKQKEYSDVDLVNTLCPFIQSRNYGLGLEKIRKATVGGGLDILLNARRVDPHEQYLKSLKWDGIQRIDTFLPTYLGVPDNQYHRLVGKNMWIAMAARGLRPGCKFDQVIILEGHEGIKKSSLVEAIAGWKYTFAPMDERAFERDDDLRKMHQSIIVELPELIGLEDQKGTKVKGFLSRTYDSIRGLWAKKSKQCQRGFIIFGTTNKKRYLSHSMGLRRYWPVTIPEKVTSIDMTLFQMNRDQLFAEAVHRFKDGENFHHIPASLQSPVVKSKIKIEPLAVPIKDVLRGVSGGVATYEVYKRLEFAGVVQKGYRHEMVYKIENALVELGYDEVEVQGEMVWAKPVVNVECFI